MCFNVMIMWPLPCFTHILQLPKKGVADLCLCQLATMYMQMHVHKISHYVAVDTVHITNKAECASSKHDDQDGN